MVGLCLEPVLRTLFGVPVASCAVAVSVHIISEALRRGKRSVPSALAPCLRRLGRSGRGERKGLRGLVFLGLCLSLSLSVRPLQATASPALSGGSRLFSYLVDPASSHMLVSKIKPCMCQYTPI